MILHLANGKTYQIPLVGKYGKYEGPQNTDRTFEVSLITQLGAKATKTFRLRGVAEAYDQFDRPELNAPHVINQAQILERALVAPITFPSSFGLSRSLPLISYRYAKGPILYSFNAVR